MHVARVFGVSPQLRCELSLSSSVLILTIYLTKLRIQLLHKLLRKQELGFLC